MYAYLLPYRGHKLYCDHLAELERLQIIKRIKKASKRTLFLTSLYTQFGNIPLKKLNIPTREIIELNGRKLKELRAENRVLPKSMLLNLLGKQVGEVYGTTPSRSMLNVIIHVFRGLGLIEYIPRKNRYYVVLTELGSVVNDMVKRAGKLVRKPVNRVLLSVLPSLVFSTKARLMFPLVVQNLARHEYLTTIKGRLYTDELHGLERIAFEVMDELVITDAGRSKIYIAEYQLLENLIIGLKKLLGEALIDIFVLLNREIRYPYSSKYPNKYPYSLGASAILTQGRTVEIEHLAPELRELINELISSLKTEFVAIEDQQQILHGYPRALR